MFKKTTENKIPKLDKPSLLEVLKNKSYLLIITSQILILISGILANTAVSFIVYQTTKNTTIMTLLIVTFVLSNVLFSTFAGVIVDRIDQRKLVLVSIIALTLVRVGILIIYLFKDLLIRTTTELLITDFGMYYFFTTINYGQFIWPLFILLFLSGASYVFFAITISSYTKYVVKKKNLLVMNSFNQAVIQIASVIGPLIAGLLVNFSYFYSFLIASLIVGFGGLISSLLFIFGVKPPIEERVMSKTMKDEMKQFTTDIKIGYNAIWKEPKILYVLIIYTFFNFTSAAFGGLYSVILQGKMEMNPTWYGAVGSVSAVIGIMTSMIIIRIGKINRKLLLVNTVILTDAIGVLLFALTRNPWIMVTVVQIPIGFTIGAANVPSQTLRQERIVREKLGRVMATVTLFTSLGNLIGMLIVTGLSTNVDPSNILLAAAGLEFLLFIIGSCVLFSNKKLRESDYLIEEKVDEEITSNENQIIKKEEKTLLDISTTNLKTK